MEISSNLTTPASQLKNKQKEMKKPIIHKLNVMGFISNTKGHEGNWINTQNNTNKRQAAF